MGEDVGRQGGAFGATKELQQRFGELRSIDTPVAESGIVGVAIGAAMAGPAARRGDAVRRLRLLRVRPAHHLRRQDALPHRLGGAAGRALPQRRRRRRRAVPLGERRGLVPPPRRASRSSARRRRPTPMGCCARRSATPTRWCSASTSSSTGAVKEDVAPGRRRRAGAARRGPRRPLRRRPLDRHVRLDGAARAGGRRHAGRGGRLGRGDRPAHAGAVRPRDGAGRRCAGPARC